MKGLFYLVSLLAATTTPATAAVISLQSAPLTQTNRECNGVANESPMTKSFGFVQLATTKIGPPQLVAIPALIGGKPNTAYNVRLIQIKNGQAVNCGYCTTGGGTLTTNKMGIGSTSVQQAVSPGATAAWVVLNEKTQCNNYYDIAPLPIA
ncbi:hypothetical protein PENSTE_c001G07721 [Penicillium steckii]|uniref:Uncharacterized protein n=1 Tax=Penicillium steckii TaxID=303698 RepID=A0A1V6U0I8_9EURO|nr:hypothetical protein PENSTE_c001G07721 [Penicillium steckii]